MSRKLSYLTKKTRKLRIYQIFSVKIIKMFVFMIMSNQRKGII
jgi:hypothetical protein